MKHALEARELSKRRAEMIDDLVELGYSQADVARELGVSRQSIQKMLAAR
ncbi:helix-turn-helix domain-containing protein [Pseudolysinimonas kribbensis]